MECALTWIREINNGWNLEEVNIIRPNGFVYFRQGSFEIAESLLESMEDGMEDDNAEGSDSEEEEDTDTLSAEWETVSKWPDENGDVHVIGI